MLRKRKLKKTLSLLLSLVLILGCFTTFVHGENNQLRSAKVDLAKIAENKIEAEVKKDMESKDLIEVLVYMEDQLDTVNVAKATRSSMSSAKTPNETKVEVRRAVSQALRDKSETSQRNILNVLEKQKEKGNVEEFKSYNIVNMVYVKATKDVIENISFMAEVGKIHKNKIVTLDRPEIGKEIGLHSDEIEWNVKRVNAHEVWDLGFDGTGAVVASLDSGVDWTHPALKEKWRGYNPATGETNSKENWFDPVYGSTLPEDSDEHGTHVMGTMVGQEPDGSNKIGVAPGAKWIAARVFNNQGSTTDSILLEAADWILAPGGNSDAAPDIVNNSWGGGDGIDSWYREVVTNWRSAEILPVFSAGNQRRGEPAPYPGSISVPSNYPESYAVAATDKNDIRGSFSKLGPSPYDESLIKPNISAPGVSIRSSVPGGKYEGGWSGTSMSAPAISGAAALLVSANSSLTVDEIENIIDETARPLTDGGYPTAPNMAYGHGMVDAFEAVSSVASGTGSISGRVLIQGEDSEEPAVIHEQEIFEAYVGSNIEISAKISDDVSVTEVELLVKAEGKSYWTQVPMSLISGDHKNGVYKGTINYDVLEGDSIVYKIKVRDFAGDVVVTEDYKIDLKFGIVPDEYIEGFESNANGWIFEGSWDFGTPTGISPQPYEGKQLAATNISGEYLNNEDSWMITPPIDLRDESLESASLRFYEWYEIENYFDKGYLMMSNDYGRTWEEVRPAVTGNAKSWKETIVNLEEYIGSPDPIFIGFRFTSDGTRQKAGWYIDDVSLIGTSCEPEVGEEISYDDGTAEDALVLVGEGNGLAVRFTPTEYGKVEKANIYLWDETFPKPGGNSLGFIVYDKDQNQVGEPIYVDNLVRGDWNEIDLSELNFSTGDDFYISTMQNAIGDNSPATGLDDNSDSDYTRSYVNIGGQLAPLADNGPDYEMAIMIRAIINYDNPDKVVNNEMIKPNIIDKKSDVEIDSSMLKLQSDGIEDKKKIKEDYVEPAEPQYPLNKKNTDFIRKGKTLKDEEVQNMETIFVGIPAEDGVVTVLETGKSVKVDPATGKYFMRSGPGEYTLRAEAYGYYSKEFVTDVVEDGNVKVNFVLEAKPYGTIQGRVVDRYNGAPASNATIRIVEDPNVAPVIADEEGYFAIEDILVGKYTLKIVADGFEPGEVTVNVTEETTPEIKIELKRFVGYEGDIIYDKGTGENALVLNAENNGLAVRFTPKEFGKVKGTNIFFWDESFPTPGGNTIGISIYDKDQKQVGKPIFQDIVRGDWNYIDLSEFGFSTNEDFYISTMQDKVGGECPATGIDEDSPHGDRSYMNLNGDFKLISQENVKGGLMIRARMEYAMDTPVITSPESETYINKDVITVEGISTADGKINIYLNDEKVKSVETENREFAVEVDVLEERNEIKVTAEIDGKETEPSEPVVVIKDKIAPTLIVEKPLDNSKIKAEVVHVIGSARDNVNLERVEINDEKIELDEEGNFHEKLILDSGENIISIKAIDVSGNETMETRTVFVELEAPKITNILPEKDVELKAGDVLTVSFNAPTGGDGYFGLMVSTGLEKDEVGIPMTEVDGLYEGTWTVPEGLTSTGLKVQVTYISEFGHKVTDFAQGKVKVISDDEIPQPPKNEITNMKPEGNVELRAGETVEISFQGPKGGTGYYRLVLPFEQDGNKQGILMNEGSDGFYSARLTAPEGAAASDLLIEFTLEFDDGKKLYNTADGRITIVGAMEDLVSNSVVVGDYAFDMDYLNNNGDSQSKLIKWLDLRKQVYYKVDLNTLINKDGQRATIYDLPIRLSHFDPFGYMTYYQR